ncbi:MAG: Ig-like domain-containing protein [Gemmatimonadota bacterium]
MAPWCFLLAMTACSTDAIPTAPAGPPQNRLVAAVRVTPSDALVEPDGLVRLSAVVRGARGQTVSGRSVQWRSSDPSVASVDADGNIVAGNEGTAKIFAEVEGVTGTGTIDVRGDVVEIRFQNSPTLMEGQAGQLSANYVYSNGAVRPAGRLRWTAADPMVASVDADGLVIARRSGETLIWAQGRGKKKAEQVTVQAEPVASVRVNYPKLSLDVGESVEFWATVQDAAGNRLMRVVSWTSSAPGVAQVDSTGVVTGQSAGPATITATSEGVSGTVDVSVVDPAGSGGSNGGGSSSAATPLPAAVQDLSAVAQGENHVNLAFTQVDDGTGSPARYEIRVSEEAAQADWSEALDVKKGSCAAPLAGTAVGSKLTCSVEGLQPSTDYEFRLVAFRGDLNQDAVFGPLSNVATARTSDPPLVVDVVPSAFTLEVGQTRQLSAKVTDAYGNELDEAVAWASSRSSVASVSAEGLVTANGVGQATIRATARGVSGSSDVTVAATETSGGGSGGNDSGGSDAGSSGSGGSAGGGTGGGGSGGAVPSAGGNVHEPAGFVKISERAFDALVEDGWGVHPKNVYGRIVQASGPISPPAAYRMFFPAGTSGGGGDVNRIGRHFSGNYTELYLNFWLLHSANWQGHKSGVNKILYVADGSRTASPFYINAHGSGVGPTLEPSVWLQGQDNTPCGYNATRRLPQNRNLQKQIVKGQWHQYELYAKLNTYDPNRPTCDGVVQLWLDGVLVVDYHDVRLLNESGKNAVSPSDWRFGFVNIDPIWGGGGDRVAQDMYRLLDHFYLSGR